MQRVRRVRRRLLAQCPVTVRPRLPRTVLLAAALVPMTLALLAPHALPRPARVRLRPRPRRVRLLPPPLLRRHPLLLRMPPSTLSTRLRLWRRA